MINPPRAGLNLAHSCSQGQVSQDLDANFARRAVVRDDLRAKFALAPVDPKCEPWAWPESQ